MKDWRGLREIALITINDLLNSLRRTHEELTVVSAAETRSPIS
jgi:hypothetical protein